MSDSNEKQLPLFEYDNQDIEEVGKEKHFQVKREDKFSRYVVYVDESGDHSLQSIDENYPIFVLAFCIFHKRHYSEFIVPVVEKFKFNYFGHDQVVLHEHEIRKESGVSNIFRSRRERSEFLEGLNEIIELSNFILVSCTIDKVKLKSEAGAESNPYHIALSSCMETLYEFLKEKQQNKKKTHVIVECRGKREDKELELEFRRICDGTNKFNIDLPFEVIFSDKKAMSSGLQLADLVARPIGLNTLKPDQANRAFEVLKEKFYCEGGRERVGTEYEGFGMKIFPAPESEKPR